MFRLKINLVVLLLVLLFTVISEAQQQKLASPRDSVQGKIDNVEVDINYGSPSVRERKIWGELVPYGKVWRAGANEATTVSFSKDVKVEGKDLKAGKYSFFTIPGEKEWTIIFNKIPNQWGAYKYTDKEDALRIKVKPGYSTKTEMLKYEITKNGFSLKWENVEIPIKVKSKS